MYDHQQIAKVLKLDPAEVEIALCASGGAFGAKEELSIQAQTALAALSLGRPVKTVLTRAESTQHHVKRHAMTIALTVGAYADGRLLAVRSRIVADAGGKLDADVLRNVLGQGLHPAKAPGEPVDASVVRRYQSRERLPAKMIL